MGLESLSLKSVKHIPSGVIESTVVAGNLMHFFDGLPGPFLA